MRKQYTNKFWKEYLNKINSEKLEYIKPITIKMKKAVEMENKYNLNFLISTTLITLIDNIFNYKIKKLLK